MSEDKEYNKVVHKMNKLAKVISSVYFKTDKNYILDVEKPDEFYGVNYYTVHLTIPIKREEYEEFIHNDNHDKTINQYLSWFGMGKHIDPRAGQGEDENTINIYYTFHYDPK